MRFSRLFLFLVLFLAGCSTCSGYVRAEIARYSNPVAGVSLNYPDRWGRIHNQQPDDILTIAAPDMRDYATCRIRMRDEGRFTVYPVSYAANIQRLHLSTAFWNDYLNGYDDVLVHQVRDNAGLGRGFASFAEVSFTDRVGETHVEKRGIMFAAAYYDKIYIVDCSSADATFGNWYPGFAYILQSVDFKKIMHEFPEGEYRNFMRDCLLRVHGQRPQDMYVQ